MHGLALRRAGELNGATVTGGAFLCDGASFEEVVDLTGATIEGQLVHDAARASPGR